MIRNTSANKWLKALKTAIPGIKSCLFRSLGKIYLIEAVCYFLILANRHFWVRDIMIS